MLTVYGIETKGETKIFKNTILYVATVLTVYGIETDLINNITIILPL